MASGSCSQPPCGACKFLRRKCTTECVFAPYFSSEQGAARFAAIHKIFGASNVSKILLHVPMADRCDAVVTIAYEAQARIRDPVYGCVGHVFELQQQVALLQSQLMQVRAQLAQSMDGCQARENHCWQGSYTDSLLHTNPYLHSMSPQSSLDSIERSSGGAPTQDMCFKEEYLQAQPCTERRAAHSDDMGELQAVALKMMRN